MDLIEQRIVEIIDLQRDKIIAFGRSIWDYPELGFKEFETAAKVKSLLRELGIEMQDGLAITAVKGYLKPASANSGKTVALIGEMDALLLADSPYANAHTGAAHCCGHNAQIAGMLGAAIALHDASVCNAIDGNVVFFAVPAEESIELGFRNQLMDQGKIVYSGGKCELIRLGAFDDIDIAIGHHIAPNIELALSNHSSNGFVSKLVCYTGATAHAAESPHLGVDAMQAANIATVAVNCQRESFRDDDTVRIHGLVTHGGDTPNVIADHVTMEYTVRANNLSALADAQYKLDRSIYAGAVATGCTVEITTLPGYLPVVPVRDTCVIEQALCDAAGSYQVSDDPLCIHGASTDFGDLSHLLPVLLFNTGGYDKPLHDKFMHPVDEELAYIVTAKVFALAAYKLTKKGNTYAQALLDSYRQLLTKAEYIEYLESCYKVDIYPATQI